MSGGLKTKRKALVKITQRIIRKERNGKKFLKIGEKKTDHSTLLRRFGSSKGEGKGDHFEW